MAGKKKSEMKQYIVIARNPETMKEGYAFVSTGERPRPLRVPFEKPVYLTEKEVAALKRQREAVEMDAHINVHEIMEKHKVSQNIANRMAQATERDRSMGGKKITFTPKYVIQPV